MKKKIFFILLVIILVFSTSMVSYAAGHTSKIEKKWLEFYKALMDQKVKDQLLSKEDANRMIAELEKQIRESKEDIIYKRFSRNNKKAPGKDRPLHDRKTPNKDCIEKMRQHQENLIKIYAGLTGKNTDEIKSECEKQDKNIWQLAHAQGKLGPFKEAVLAQAKADVEQKVKNGDLTKEEGDKLLKRITDHVTKIDFKGS